MLILSRKVGESVTIEGGIVVSVVRVSGDAVRLGFEVPREVRVDRTEIAERIAAERAAGLSVAAERVPAVEVTGRVARASARVAS